MDKILKKRTIFNLLSDIEIVSDPDYQKKVWYSDNKETFGSFDEMICSFFDMYEIDELHEHPSSFGLSQEQYGALKQFAEKLDEYSDNVPDNPTEKRLMTDPGWHFIQDLAKKTLECFGKWEDSFSDS